MTPPNSRQLSPTLEQRRVLLVEHDRDLAAVFLDLLRVHGGEVLLATTTADALRALDHDALDVVVLDLDGLERPFEVLGATRTRATVVLAGIARGYAPRARALGMRWVFEKPVELETLLHAVATAVPA